MDRWENKTPKERAQIQKRQKEIADRWSKQQAQKKKPNSEAASKGERERERGRDHTRGQGR